MTSPFPTICCETSPDKATWTQRATIASSTFPSLSYVHVAFFAETYASLSAPGVAKYANLNR
jgi:hypothetical protein